MEAIGLFTIARYRGCVASAFYVISDVISEDGWHLGWQENKMDAVVARIIDAIA